MRTRDRKCEETEERHFFVNGSLERTHNNLKGTVKYPRNIICNQRYSLFTFLPKVFAQQLKHFLNVFFILVMVMQLFPPVRVSHPLTSIFPWTLVQIFVYIKEGVDDYKRYRRDREANDKQCTRYTEGGPVRVPASEIATGDLIIVGKDERVPADAILLKTEDDSGSIFVRTDQLDGETDWKIKMSPSVFQNATFDEIAKKYFEIEAEAPSKEIYSFSGKLYVDGIQYTVHEDNMLWMNMVIASGTSLCVVVYTGKDTRAVMNTTRARNKSGRIDTELNFYTKILCTASFSFAVLFTALRGTYSLWYITLVRFIIIFSTVIPISLRVNIDWARLVYARTMENDVDTSVVVRNSNIPEELGRISYILTDKTGTLTKNEMEIKKMHTGDLCYTPDFVQEIREIVHSPKSPADHSARTLLLAMCLCNNVIPYTEKESNKKNNDLIVQSSHINKEADKSLDGASSSGNTNNNNSNSAENITEDGYISSNLNNIEDAAESNYVSTGNRNNEDFVQNENSARNEDSSANGESAAANDEVGYISSSPDEIAMVQWASRVGMTLCGRGPGWVEVQELDNDPIRYEVLHSIRFTSEKKCMGVVIRSKDSTYLYMKGADSVMKHMVTGRLSGWMDEEAEAMAKEGLRTMVFGRRRISNEEAEELILSQQNMSDDQQKGLDLLGITGVEDKLQDGVRVSLETLRDAGIKVWMLTGDKVETARCIAISSRLFPRCSTILTIASIRTRQDADIALKKIQRERDCLIIDGMSLQVLMDIHRNEFILALMNMTAVAYCRCSPTQKAEIARALSDISGERVCCIGDGGNDVSMIQQADVGIGIVGKEGRQASLAADFSINEFKSLIDLILWHGRNSYKNTAKLAQFIIHRGTTLGVAQGIFSSLFSFCPISIYQGKISIGYVTFYTFLPVFSIVLSKDMAKKVSRKFPELYSDISNGSVLNDTTFSMWMFMGYYQGVVIMVLTLVFFENALIQLVSITFSCLVLNELLMVFLCVSRVHKVMIVAQSVSILMYLVSFKVLSDEISIPKEWRKFLVQIILVNMVAILPAIVQWAWRLWMNPPSYRKIQAAYSY
ncbi:phospholipid-translocating ATPase [Nematocida minor]|uniref:phospholipid-translocating ATPase n=1 Tax=Nematocida minor TaxID=1912983 RepID=UPI00221FBB57|nr:phospholipid-translocating ATPase [Nematocida minor]KAI5190666.1 phospholipid-translocating ATPase [Nematocida minor]